MRQKVDHFRRRRFAGDEIARREWACGESANRHQGAVQGQRLDDRVQPAAVRQPAFDHGTGLVDPPSDAPGDALQNLKT